MAELYTGESKPEHFKTDSSLVEKELGIKWISFEDSVKDTLGQILLLDERRVGLEVLRTGRHLGVRDARSLVRERLAGDPRPRRHGGHRQGQAVSPALLS
jgi:hypothetical protein